MSFQARKHFGNCGGKKSLSWGLLMLIISWNNKWPNKAECVVRTVGRRNNKIPDKEARAQAVLEFSIVKEAVWERERDTWRMNSFPVPALNPVAYRGRTSDRYFKQGRYTVGFSFAALDHKPCKWKEKGRGVLIRVLQRNGANRICQDTEDKIYTGDALTGLGSLWIPVIYCLQEVGAQEPVVALGPHPKAWELGEQMV